MPEDTDEKDLELGSAPTAVTSVESALGSRNKLPTQELKAQGEDPAWAAETLSPGDSLEITDPSGRSQPPAVPLGERVRKLFSRTQHEWKKLPSGMRLGAVIAGSLGLGLVVGLAAGHSNRAPAGADEELPRLAKRLTIPERDAVMHALMINDPVSALMMLRSMSAKDHVATDPLALALRGRLALVARDADDALDQLEAAVAAQPKLGDSEPWLAPAVVQTFIANKPARTTALLGKVDKVQAAMALKTACMDWQVRVRRSAAEALKASNDNCPDAVGVLLVDGFQADRCDTAKNVLQKLVPLAATDDRIPAALDAMSRRPSIAKCVADLIPRK